MYIVWIFIITLLFNICSAGLEQLMQQVKSKPIQVIGIGVTKDVDSELLKRLVSPPSDQNYISVDKFSDLSGVLDTVIQQASCSTPTQAPTTGFIYINYITIFFVLNVLTLVLTKIII